MHTLYIVIRVHTRTGNDRSYVGPCCPFIYNTMRFQWHTRIVYMYTQYIFIRVYPHAQETIDRTWDQITHISKTQWALNGTLLLCRYISIHVVDIFPYMCTSTCIHMNNIFIHVYGHAEETIDLTWDHIAHLYTTQRAFNGTLVPAHATGRNCQYSA